MKKKLLTLCVGVGMIFGSTNGFANANHCIPDEAACFAAMQQCISSASTGIEIIQCREDYASCMDYFPPYCP